MARTTLSIRSTPAKSAPVQTVAETAPAPEPTCYARNGTEVVFTATAALITHDGTPGQTEDTVAANVDSLFFSGAFAELRATGTFMKTDGQPLDDAGNYYALSIDPALLATIDAQTLALDAAASAAPAETDGFVEDTLFSAGTAAPIGVDAPAVAVPAIDAPEGDEVEIDLAGGELAFATTKAGAPYATLRNPGARTVMAFGPVAEALRGQSAVSCIVVHGRSTDKIVAVRLPGANDLIVEAARAA